MATPEIKRLSRTITKCFSPCKVLLCFQIHFCDFIGMDKHKKTGKYLIRGGVQFSFEKIASLYSKANPPIAKFNLNFIVT